ncbi:MULTISPECIES: 4'-phosphopantetheinyl transferase family protein [Clostridium]|uniref:Phosphopantetheine--protein transferase domain-containing protein n=2 Tax=Clostridium cadaveris TaxID=1529 RepID=A0A1I2MCI1_9CLOT|nr:4'-phosphopantetheinyl transferase superfamily protein [Clostridium cadaveris]MDU4952696.1 4'-phosphopantetheinyl transferase superfamily protein [Clostridium sp.]MDM8311799.1 4'-phosphopantetheinyl transferase superfamily protein [Clostridium cadaveris]MDY4950202.1 4'-phosphopantetheinyl transferase superfamily protein [Clostridium cadaveris]NME64906.1 4'-phosphopantetheinyl transferase superfamily protein [Clostridium cadaveris]NWK11586.1 4'-phosphopantetheinyl transferase superfamily pro
MIYIVRGNFKEREASHIAWKVLDDILKKELGVSLNKLTIKKNEFGKPYIEENSSIKFNISHCDGIAVCGVGGGEFGVDVEKIRTFNKKVAMRICSKEELQCIDDSTYPEKQFFIYWTLKESLGKALGVGLNYSMREVTFTLKKTEISCSLEGYEFMLYELYSKYLLAICVPRGV